MKLKYKEHHYTLNHKGKNVYFYAENYKDFQKALRRAIKYIVKTDEYWERQRLQSAADLIAISKVKGQNQDVIKEIAKLF